MGTNSVRIGLIQQALVDDRNTNLDVMQRSVERAARAGAQVIVLPELFSLPYFCQQHDPEAFERAEVESGPSVERMRSLAQATGSTLVVPYFERRAHGIYHNSLVVIGEQGETRGRYRKMHIPDDPGFEEKYYFTPGDNGFSVISTAKLELGALICYDQWFPEAARLMALGGAELLCYPTAIGWQPEEKEQLGAAQLEAWRTVQRAHAIANGIFVAAVNRVGTERSGPRSIEFWGHSFVCDPAGKVLGELGEEPGELVCDIELRAIEEQRRWWPFLRDRRIDAYQGLLARYRNRGEGSP